MQSRLPTIWPIILLAVLAALFFLGSIYLELEAADLGANALLRHRDGLTQPEILEAVKFQVDRVKGMERAASAAIDISKIALGALIATITHYMAGVFRESAANKSES